jgi:hypothetical protein
MFLLSLHKVVIMILVTVRFVFLCAWVCACLLLCRLCLRVHHIAEPLKANCSLCVSQSSKVVCRVGAANLGNTTVSIIMGDIILTRNAKAFDLSNHRTGTKAIGLGTIRNRIQ